VLVDAKKRAEVNTAELDRRVDESLQRAGSFFTTEQKEMKRLEDRVASLEARLCQGSFLRAETTTELVIHLEHWLWQVLRVGERNWSPVAHAEVGLELSQPCLNVCGRHFFDLNRLEHLVELADLVLRHHVLLRWRTICSGTVERKSRRSNVISAKVISGLGEDGRRVDGRFPEVERIEIAMQSFMSVGDRHLWTVVPDVGPRRSVNVQINGPDVKPETASTRFTDGVYKKLAMKGVVR
jgi:hypothetical protein